MAFINVDSKITITSLKNIEIPVKTLQDLKKYLDESNITYSQLNKYANENLNSIQIEAKKYLTKLLKIMSNTAKIINNWKESNLLEISLKQGKAGSAYQYCKIKNNQKEFFAQFINDVRNVVLQTQSFTFLLKEILNFSPVVEYTPLDNEGKMTPYIYELGSFEELLNVGGKNLIPTLQKSKAQMDVLVEQGKAKLIDKTHYLSPLQAQYLENVYMTFIQRYERNQKKDGKHLILIQLQQQQPSTWGRVWFVNRGPIVEAYHNAVFARQEIFKNELNPPPELDMIRFMTLVQQVDSTPEVLESDTEYKNIGFISKSGAAGVPGFQGAIKIAKQLLDTKIDEKTIKAWLKYKKEKNKGTSLVQPIKILTRQTFQEAINQSLNS